MIAGVAHEINTPLAYVRNGLQLHQQVPLIRPDLPLETRKLLDLLAAGDADELQSGLAVRSRARAVCAGRRWARSQVAGVIRDGIYGIEQISEIVTNLKNFSRLDRSKTAHFSLNEGLESTLIIARHLLKDKHIEKDFC